MERVKIFNCNETISLEEGINKWLVAMGDKIEITRTLQTSSAVEEDGRIHYEFTITIFYKNK